MSSKIGNIYYIDRNLFDSCKASSVFSSLQSNRHPPLFNTSRCTTKYRVLLGIEEQKKIQDICFQ